MTSSAAVAIPKIATENTNIAKLHHPVAPNPWPMYLRMNQDVAHLWSLPKLKRSYYNGMGCIYFRVMLLLHLEGATTEAKAVSDVLRMNFPSVWYYRKSLAKKFNKDPKLRHIRARRGEAANKDEQQYALVGLDSEKLHEDDAAVKEIDDLLAETETEVEEPDYVVSSELLEVRSANRRSG